MRAGSRRIRIAQRPRQLRQLREVAERACIVSVTWPVITAVLRVFLGETKAVVALPRGPNRIPPRSARDTEH